MLSTGKIAESTAEYSPYVAELREFLASRAIPFGSVEDLAPFLERLRTDPVFRDEMSSMVRAIIYRARDGFSQTELLDLLVVAVAGQYAPGPDEPFRELLRFVEGVFRSRWNTVPETIDPSEAPQEPRTAEQPHDSPAITPPTNQLPPQPHRAQNTIFSRAHQFSDVASHLPPSSAAAHRQHVSPEWAGNILSESYDSEPVTRHWVWGSVFAAVVLVFCAGLFFAQRTAVNMFQQPNDHLAGAAKPSSEAAASANPGQQPAHPLPASDPGPAIRPAKPSPAQPATRADTRELGASGRSQSFSDAAGYTPATLGLSPALMRSRLIYAPRPEYPAIARLAHIQGKVVVEAVVSRNGRVTHADVISGHRLLRGAALKAVRQRKYRPYVVEGKPRAVATLLTVDFRLRGR